MIPNLITYEIATAVDAGVVNFKKLEREIAASGAVQGFRGLPAVQGVLFVLGDSIVDEALLDVTIATHVAVSLDDARLERITELGVEFTEFMNGRYPQPVQMSFSFYMHEAQGRSFQARRTEIQKVIDWLSFCLDEFFAKKNAVLAAQTIAATQAVALDLTLCAESDPLVSLDVVRRIVA